jgi:hypothetical protein
MKGVATMAKSIVHAISADSFKAGTIAYQTAANGDIVSLFYVPCSGHEILYGVGDEKGPDGCFWQAWAKLDNARKCFDRTLTRKKV